MDGAPVIGMCRTIELMRKLPPHTGSTTRQPHGFTLIELMITLAIVGVLAMIAVPAYFDQIRKSRRGEATTVLSAVQQAQERWRANCTSYTTNLTAAVSASGVATCDAALGLGMAASTPSGRYVISVPAASASAYQVTAVAATGSDQNKDRATGGVSCSTLTLTAAAGNLGYAPAACWSR
jgi:type IV pilus assembly protein PilE